MTQKFFGLMLTIILALSGSMMVNPAHAATSNYLGELDLWQWCIQRQQGDPNNPLVLESPGDAGNWKCRSIISVPSTDPNGTIYVIVHRDIDTQNVCKWQYGYGDAFALAANWQDPYSWKCYLPEY